MSSKKVLWIGDAVASTGFARVNHAVIDRLDKNYYDITVLGINHHGDPHNYDYNIYPAYLGGDVWGFGRLPSMVNNLQPDVIFILNDPWVVNEYLQILKKEKIKVPVVVYFPVDATGFHPGWFKHYDLVQKVCVYTQFGKDVVTDLGVIDEEQVEIIPHGSDPERFYPFEDYYNSNGDLVKTAREIAREGLYPIAQQPELMDAFIILNANRNQPRKRVDLTMEAFRIFNEDKDDTRLYLHMGNRDAGWNIQFLAEKWGFTDKLILSVSGNQMPNVPDERLNLIYNATDVGINTSMGEGWGLVNWEQGSIGKPQIVPEHSACAELWRDIGILVDAPDLHVYRQTSTEGRVPDVDSIVDALEWAYEDFHSGGEELAKLGKAAQEKILSSEYSWESIADKFDSVFREVLE